MRVEARRHFEFLDAETVCELPCFYVDFVKRFELVADERDRNDKNPRHPRMAKIAESLVQRWSEPFRRSDFALVA